MKKPWNLIDLPVYSLATYAGEKINMNICTYVTAVSMKPKLYAVAVYHQTKTLENMLESDEAVLHLLNQHQYRLVRTLGKKSGLQYNKEKYLLKHNHITAWQQKKVLKDAVSWVLLKKTGQQTTGDHDLFLFEVKAYKVNNNIAPLMLSELRAKKIIIA